MPRQSNVKPPPLPVESFGIPPILYEKLCISMFKGIFLIFEFYI